MVTFKKSSTKSGAHWRTRAAATAEQLRRNGIKTSTIRERVDGYLLTAKAVAGMYIVEVMDLPSWLGFVGGYTDPGQADSSKEAFSIARFVLGRDEFYPEFHTSDRTPPSVGFLETVTEISPISSGFLASVGVNPAATEERQSAFSLAMKPFDQAVVSHGQVLITPPPESAPPHEFMFDAYGELFFRFYHPGGATVTLEPVAGGHQLDPNDDSEAHLLAGGLVVGDVYSAANLGGPFFTQVIQEDTVPPLVSNGFDDIVSEANAQPSTWVTTCPVAIDTEANAYSIVAAVPTVNQLNDHDSYGSRRLGIFSMLVSFDEDENLVAQVSSYGYLDMTLFGTYSQPVVDPAVTDGRDEHYRLNRQHPAYMARIGDNTVAMMLRYSASRYDSAAGTYGTIDDGMFHTVYAYVLDVATTFTASYSVVQPAGASDYTINQDYWYVHGLGMDSNYGDSGEDPATAVYVGIHPGMYNSPSLDDARVGVVEVTAAGATKYSFFDVDFIPHATWLPGQFVGFLDECYSWVNVALRQAMYDVVTYIGNGKFVFPASTLAGSSYSLAGDVRVFTDWDTVLVQYDITDHTLSVVSTIRANAVGLDLGAIIPGKISVVQRQVADAESNITQEAVLLASIGSAYGATSMNDDGETYVSYDSGATWDLMASVGHGRGAMYAGGMSYDFKRAGLIQE